MATPQTFSFGQLVSNIAAAVQGAASSLVDFRPGSINLAVAQATSAIVLWLQAIILQVLTLTRASTSRGDDLHSWGADYGFDPLAAEPSTGLATFARFTATQQAVVPVGSTVQTQDGSQNFAVIVDTTNSAYDASLGGYVLPVNTASISAPVQATLAGSGGNVQAGTIAVITIPIPGVDTVTNAAPFANGIDAEPDPAYRVRFVAYLASLSKATRAAIGYAISNVQQGIDYTLTENQDYDGTQDFGFFYAVIDDGTGYPSGTLQTSAYNAIDAVRALTVRFAVYAPVVVTANVAMTITSATGYTHSVVVAAVQAAITTFIDGLKLGVGLPYTQLAGIAYEIPGVANVTGILLNSGTSDITATAKQKLLAGTVSVA